MLKFVVSGSLLVFVGLTVMACAGEASDRAATGDSALARGGADGGAPDSTTDGNTPDGSAADAELAAFDRLTGSGKITKLFKVEGDWAFLREGRGFVEVPIRPEDIADPDVRAFIGEAFEDFSYEWEMAGRTRDQDQEPTLTAVRKGNEGPTFVYVMSATTGGHGWGSQLIYDRKVDDRGHVELLDSYGWSE